MTSRAAHPLRLPPRRWETYADLSGGAYPGDQVATYPAYSWEGRPVPGTDYSTLPLFWSPAQAARTLNATLEYYLSDLCAVPPLRFSPQRRPRAIIYARVYDTLLNTTRDVVAEALAPIADDLRAKGVWAGPAFPYYYYFDPADPSRRKLAWAEERNTLTGVVFPATGYDFTVNDLPGDVFFNYHRLWEGGCEGGEIMYVTPGDWATGSGGAFFTVVSASSGPGIAFARLAESEAQELDLLLRLGEAHDRLLCYGAFAGEGLLTDLDTGKTDWQLCKEVFADFKSNSGGLFDYCAVEGLMRTSALNRAQVAANVRAAAAAFFNL